MNILVSILVPIYNVENFIEKCSVSLFEQTYKNIEYVFVNDCSPDHSIEVLEKVAKNYPNRINSIKIINHDVNKGLAGARNTAILNATGEYLLHVDSDDFIELDTVEILMEKVNQEKADIVVFDYYLEWRNTNKLVRHRFEKDRIKYLNLVLSAKTENFVVNKLIKRSLYIDNNLLHTQGLNFGEDYLIVPKLLFFSKKLAKVDKAFYHYVRFNDNSYTSSISKKNIEDLICVYCELSSFLSDRGFDRRSLLIGCLNKKFELIRYSKSVDNFIFIKNNFIIENNDIILSEYSGVKKLMLKMLDDEKYSQLRFLTKAYRFLISISQIVKNRG